MMDLRFRSEGMPGYWEDAYGSTPLTAANVPVRTADGRFIVELQSAALQSDESAAMTIAHELKHLRQFMNGMPYEEAPAEQAAETMRANWRG